MSSRNLTRDVLERVRAGRIVGSRIVVRSWSLRTLSWYRTLLKDPSGTIVVDGKETAVRVARIRSDRVRDQVDATCLAKYDTPFSLRYAGDLCRDESRAATIELLPAPAPTAAAGWRRPRGAGLKCVVLTVLGLLSFVCDAAGQTKRRVFIEEIGGSDAELSARFKSQVDAELGRLKDTERAVSRNSADLFLGGYGLLEFVGTASSTVPVPARQGVVRGSQASIGSYGTVMAKLMLKLTAPDGQSVVADVSASSSRSDAAIKSAVVSALRELQKKLAGMKPARQAAAADAAIRVETELLQLRATVFDRSGNAVEDLSQADFALTDNGHAREIAFFSARRSDSPSSTAERRGTPPVPRPKTPAVPEPSRSILLLVDPIHNSPEGFSSTRDVLAKYVDELMEEGDLVAISAGATSTPFTRDREALRTAIRDVLLPRFDEPPDPFLTPAAARAVMTLPQHEIDRLLYDQADAEVSNLPTQSAREAMRKLLIDKTRGRPRVQSYLMALSVRRRALMDLIRTGIDALAVCPGQRILFLLSEGFSLVDQAGGISERDLHAVFARAAQSGVVLNCVDCTGIKANASAARRALAFNVWNEDKRLNQEGMRTLAVETGGEAVFETGEVAGAMKKMLGTSRAYYEISFYPAGGGDPEQFRRIRLTVPPHPDYRVRTQQGYVLSRLRKSPLRNVARGAAATMVEPGASAARSGEPSAKGAGEAGAASAAREAPRSKSIVERPAAEVATLFPELKDLDTSPTAVAPEEILRRTGDRVAVFFTDIPNSSSVESVRCERWNAAGRLEDQKSQDFNYLVAARPERGAVGLEEYRTNSRGERISQTGLDGSYLLTSGYAATSAYFHPSYAEGCDYRLLGREARGDRAFVVGFAQRRDGPIRGAIFAVGELSRPMTLHGIAWIHPESFQIVRMRTDLVDPMTDLGLSRHTTEIRFAEIYPGTGRQSVWLPLDVTVTLVWQGTTFRNRHRYSDYRRFSVESIEGAKTPVKP